MPTPCKEFVINATIGKLSRYIDGERYYTDTEEHFKFPWKIEILRNNQFIGLYLRTEREKCETNKWSMKTEFTLALMSQNGNRLMKKSNFTFERPDTHGYHEFMSWKDMESDYVVNDSIIVEARVRIIKMKDAPQDEDEIKISSIGELLETMKSSRQAKYMPQKKFRLYNTVKYISSIKEGENYFTKTEKHYNVPWRLQISRQNGFFKLSLQCVKERSESNDWSLEVEFMMRLMSENGQVMSCDGALNAKQPCGCGWDMLIRWDDMEKKYMVHDRIILEARVKIIKMIGCDDE